MDNEQTRGVRHTKPRPKVGSINNPDNPDNPEYDTQSLDRRLVRGGSGRVVGNHLGSGRIDGNHLSEHLTKHLGKNLENCKHTILMSTKPRRACWLARELYSLWLSFRLSSCSGSVLSS